jgi:hypothetical protein
MLVKVAEWKLALVTVTVWGELVSPTCLKPKLRLEAENVKVSGVYSSELLKTTQQTLVVPMPPSANARPVPSRVVE